MRTEIPSALVPTPTTAPSQPPAELRGRAGKQQHGAGEQCPGREKGERAGRGRRTGHMPHLSPSERAHPRSHTPYRSSAAPSGGRGPLLPPAPWDARNRAGAAQPAEEDRERRRSYPPTPLPQPPRYTCPASARLPTATLPSYRRYLPPLPHQPRPRSPAARPAPPPDRAFCKIRERAHAWSDMDAAAF